MVNTTAFQLQQEMATYLDISHSLVHQAQDFLSQAYIILQEIPHYLVNGL